jgi:hypothetical protein
MASGLLEVPLRYMHTPCEVVNLVDVENCGRLMAAYCRRIQPDTGFVAGAAAPRQIRSLGFSPRAEQPSQKPIGAAGNDHRTI